MLVAEGAVDIATEQELKLHDMAALSVIVEEAGGTFTGLDGRPGPHSGNALATNGRLHELAMTFVGDKYHTSNDSAGGSVHDLNERRQQGSAEGSSPQD